MADKQQNLFQELANENELSSELDDGSVEFVLDDEGEFIPQAVLVQEQLVEAANFENNLVYILDEEELQLIAQDVLEGFETDFNSRQNHVNSLVKGLKNLGIAQAEEQDLHNDGACDAFHPLLLESAVKFQATETKELLPANGIVKTKIIGAATQELENQATRVRNHMNWQLDTEMHSYRSSTEKALFQTALFGDAFKKFYYNSTHGRPDSCLVSFEDFVVNSNAQTIRDCERYTHVIRKSETEFLRDIDNGLYAPRELTPAYSIMRDELGTQIDKLIGVDYSNYEGYELLEQHVYMHIPGDPLNETGQALPYIITVEKGSNEVISVYRNWEQNGNPYKKNEYFVQYPFIRAFGFYNLGLIHLIGDYQKTLTVLQRALVDAGQLANLPAGFKNKNARLSKGETLDGFEFGEWKDVDILEGRIQDAFYPLPFKEPSNVLFSMFQSIQAGGQKFADSTDQVVSDSTNYGPVGTTMALLEASTRLHSAVHTRLHEAQKQELSILSDLNYNYLPDDPSMIAFNIPTLDPRIFREDYSGLVDIIPVSDPNISSNAHRVSLANAKLQSAMLRPDLHNMKALFKEYYSALGVENPEAIMLPEAPAAQPQDPMTDIQAASKGVPIQAFPGQDHDAHIAVKTQFLENPEFGANQMMASIVPILQANIRDHVILKYQSRLEAALEQNPNVQEATKMLGQLTEYLDKNPDGLKDPKQLLAEAQVMQQQNKARELEIEDRDNQITAAIDYMEAQIKATKVQLDAAKHKDKMEYEKQLKQFEAALDLIKQAGIDQSSQS